MASLPAWQKALIALFLVAVVVAEGVLLERDLRFARGATRVDAEIESFFERGGGRGQTRWAQLRFEWSGQGRVENAQLGLFCRPDRGPTSALYNPDMRLPMRVDTHLCRHTATDGALLVAGMAFGFGLTRIRRRDAAP